MSKTEIGPAEIRQISDETAWRDVWYAHVMTEAGNTPPNSPHEKETISPPHDAERAWIATAGPLPASIPEAKA
ncbi:MAG: hypothetical protein WB463_04345, partial [Pseudolabrys sp.]